MFTSVTIEPVNNSVSFDKVENSIDVTTFKVWSDYYFLQATQILQEDSEA